MAAASLSPAASALAVKSARSISPFPAAATTTTSIPAICAEAGLVPCAETGIRQISRSRSPRAPVIGGDGQKARIFALRAGIGLHRHRVIARDLAQPRREGPRSSRRNPRPGRRARRGWIALNSGQVIGIISTEALSFIVQDPPAGSSPGPAPGHGPKGAACNASSRFRRGSCGRSDASGTPMSGQARRGSPAGPAPAA